MIRIINPVGTEFRHIVKVRTVQMRTKYAQLERMLQSLSQRTKPAQSGAFLALPHPHIISWKIPNICCNFCVPPTLVHLGL